MLFPGASHTFLGSVGFGSAPLAGRTIDVPFGITGSVNGAGVFSRGAYQSDVTSLGRVFAAQTNTAAASFTLSNLYGYDVRQGTFGAGSTVSVQIGHYADSSLTGATNNYGFYSAIAAGTNRFNFYAAGSAPNYFAGNTTVGAAMVVGSTVSAVAVLATPAGGAAALFMGTASLGIYFGSGTPTVSAAKGSLYLRTDGTTTNDRMYVNTNGATNWTAVTTAA